MAYIRVGRGTTNRTNFPTAEAKELQPEDIDADTTVLDASMVFARRKTSTGRAIDKATRDYNQTQLHALHFYMKQFGIKPTLANLTAKVIGDFIDYLRNWRFEPKRVHDRCTPTANTRSRGAASTRHTRGSRKSSRHRMRDGPSKSR